MKKYFVKFLLFVFISTTTQAQNKIQEQLFYYSAKGLSFIPPLSRPGLIYDGKLYIGSKKLSTLFSKLNDEQLNLYFKKYKSNKTTADILTFTGSFALPIVNIIVSANDGKLNWWLMGASILMGGTGGFLNVQAQKNLLMASLYYDKKMGYTTATLIPQQQSIGIVIPLGK